MRWCHGGKQREKQSIYLKNSVREEQKAKTTQFSPVLLLLLSGLWKSPGDAGRVLPLENASLASSAEQ